MSQRLIGLEQSRTRSCWSNPFVAPRYSVTLDGSGQVLMYERSPKVDHSLRKILPVQGPRIRLALNSARVGHPHTKLWTPSLVTSNPVMSQ